MEPCCGESPLIDENVFGRALYEKFAVFQQDHIVRPAKGKICVMGNGQDRGSRGREFLKTFPDPILISDVQCSGQIQQKQIGLPLKNTADLLKTFLSVGKCRGRWAIGRITVTAAHAGRNCMRTDSSVRKLQKICGIPLQ